MTNSQKDLPFIARVADKDSRVYELALWYVWLSGASLFALVTWFVNPVEGLRWIVTGIAFVTGFAASFFAFAYVVNAEYFYWKEMELEE